MSELRGDLVATYASILHEENAVTFEHDERIYRIWESSSEEGWYIEVLEVSEVSLWAKSLNTIISEEPWIEADGGLCTGSAKDAVEFMLPQAYVLPESQLTHQGGE